jgi:polar amino acid transport system substrate-binding protein
MKRSLRIREHGMKAILPLMVAAIVGLNGPAQARPLNTIREFGAIGLCAHPNSLPFASKAGNPPGFQVELGQALARELGVALRLDWIITQYQMRSAGCDIVLDVIADREAQGETRLAISKPYYRTGVALAVPSASKLTSFKSLDANTKVGVQVASMAAMNSRRSSRPTDASRNKDDEEGAAADAAAPFVFAGLDRAVAIRNNGPCDGLTTAHQESTGRMQ